MDNERSAGGLSFKKIAGDPARIFAALVVLFTVLALFFSYKSPLSQAIRSQKPILGLIAGTDWVDNARHSDTIVLARYNPADRTLDMLSIPRDTRIDYPKARIKRINEVYAYAFKNSNRNYDSAIKELMQEVRRLVFFKNGDQQSGADSAPEITYYAQFDYDGFKKTVDLLGGVPVTVDEPMHYDDNWGKLHIHFDPGKYVLNGQKALEYVRFRGLSGDYGRVLRQQEFLMNALDTLKKPYNILRLPKILTASMSAIKTNTSWLDRFLLLWEFKNLPRGSIRLVQLPGKPVNGFWIPDYDAIAATAGILAGEPEKAPEMINTAVEVSSHAADTEDIAAQPKRITVEVWNASGRKGVALDVARVLRKEGFDVVKWGNYSSRQKRTMVRDKRGDTKNARKISTVLAANRIEVYTRVESNPLADMEVIIGEDYQEEGKGQ